MKQKLLKTMRVLLVAAGLCVGSSAWAGDVSTIYTKDLAGWSSGDVTKTENSVDKWYNSTGIVNGDYLTGMMIDVNNGLRLAARNTTATTTLTLNRAANTIVTIDAVWNVGSASADGNTPHTQFIYGDLMIQQNVRSNNLTTTYKINGVTTTVGTDKFARGDDMIIHLKVNSVSGKISEFYLKNGETTVAQFSDLNSNNNTFAAASNYDAITMLAWISASSSYAWCALKSITVQQETQDVATASVTFKYADTSDNSLSALKADELVNGIAVGTEISSLISTYNATFYNGENNKYVYNSYVVTGDYNTVQSGGNTVTLKFTDYPATAYNIKAQVSDTDVKTLVSGTTFLDGSTTKYWSKYFNENDQWYVADETTYGMAITSATPIVSFTATSDIDYFFEAEDMTVSRTYGTASNDTKYSGGAGSGIYGSGTITTKTTISAGIYTIGISSITRNSDKSQTYKISYSTDNNTWITTGKNITFTTAAGVNTSSTTEVIIPGESYIRLTEGNGGNAQDYLDYVILKRTGDLPANQSVTIANSENSFGYSSLASAYNLDFAKATTTTENAANLTAFVVTEIDNEVTLSSIEQAPANTGVILKGTPGATYSIPVIASAEAPAKNLLMAAVTATPIEANEAYILQGGLFHKVTAASTVPAGKAYLLASDVPSEARSLNFLFADNATGINGISSELQNGEFYNLQGQRIETPTKGLYIVNGTKVIIK